MKPNDAFKYATGVQIIENIGKVTGVKYKFREFTYGVLVPSLDHPLCCVSVANSSLSIDLWKGCALQCAYCHVQDSFMDLENGKMPTRIIPRSRFSIVEILDELEKHPYFVRDLSVLSIGTASTEPFAKKADESTFTLMEEIVRRGWRNPIWIVTKAGFPAAFSPRLVQITKTNKVMISFCWASNPKEIEPAVNDRFANIDFAKKAGATCAWYMRPLAVDWGANVSRIKQMMDWVIQKEYSQYIDMIVPGGLRWADGIQYGLTEIHGLPMPNIAKDDNQKDLPDEIWEAIIENADKLFPRIPVFKKSSCALSYMIGTPDLGSTYLKNDCATSVCSYEQRAKCSAHPLLLWNKENIQMLLNRLSIPVVVESFYESRIISNPSISIFGPTIETVLKKFLSFGPSFLHSKHLNF